MKERIKKLRNYLKLSQEEFGAKIGVTKSTISNIETGRFNATDTSIKLICKEFNVNELWLRTGVGEMFNTIDDDFIAMSMNIVKNGDDFIKEFTKMLWSLDMEELKAIQKIVKSIKNNPNL